MHNIFLLTIFNNWHIIRLNESKGGELTSRSIKMLVAYWDKLIGGIDAKIEKLENELKTITDPVERIERNGKIIALLDLKIDLQNGEFGELEIGD